MPWECGAGITVRHVWFGRVWAAFPVTVVQNSPDCLAVYIAPGTPFIAPDCTRSGYLKALASRQWSLRKATWDDHHMLWITVPGEACSVWKIWYGSSWIDKGWKVNPERALTRTQIGFDTADYILDAVVAPDMSSWCWKDEDELEEGLQLGVVTLCEATEARVQAQRVISRFPKVAGLDYRVWSAWRPPSSWTAPRLPLMWSRVAST